MSNEPIWVVPAVKIFNSFLSFTQSSCDRLGTSLHCLVSAALPLEALPRARAGTWQTHETRLTCSSSCNTALKQSRKSCNLKPIEQLLTRSSRTQYFQEFDVRCCLKFEKTKIVEKLRVKLGWKLRPRSAAYQSWRIRWCPWSQWTTQSLKKTKLSESKLN